MDFLTQDELDALRLSFLDTSSPLVIGPIIGSQFSIALHYGGCTAFGHRYTYFSYADLLVRDDAIAWLKKYRKEQKQAEKRQQEDKQGTLL